MRLKQFVIHFQTLDPSITEEEVLRIKNQLELDLGCSMGFRETWLYLSNSQQSDEGFQNLRAAIPTIETNPIQMGEILRSRRVTGKNPRHRDTEYKAFKSLERE